MWTIKVIEVNTNKNLSSSLAGLSVDSPKANDVFLDYILPVSGWILGKDKPARSIILSSGTGRTIIPVNTPRSKVFENFKDKYPWAEKAGFHQLLTIQHASGVTEFLMSAKIGIETIDIGTIKLNIEFNRQNINPKFTPIMLTALGRSGTTFCMQSLSNHPEIAATRIYPYEVRMTQHFMESLRSALQFGDTKSLPKDIREHLCYEYVQHSIRYTVDCIDQFYSTVARSNNQTKAHYFVEKTLPLQFQGWIHDIYPNAKEIILVRDFRDMICSILSFNQKRGFNDFSRQNFDSDIEYVRHMNGPKNLFSAWQKRKEKALLVRYEDLILDDQATLKRIFNYLGIDSSASIVSKICDLVNNPQDRLKEHMTSNSRKKSIGRWREELPTELVSASHDVFGEFLQVFGYDR